MRVCVLACLALLAAPIAGAEAQIVVLDPGHGGMDPGAVGCRGLEEAPNVLDVAQRAQLILEAEGLTAELTRDDDRFVGLSARAAYANDLGARLFVSIHSNSNGGTPATGTETFLARNGSATSGVLAGHLQRELIATWMLRDRGVKRANFTVLTATRMPAALTEVCFTNNCAPDAELLRDPAQRGAIAEAHARAILETLGREPPMAGGGSLRGVVFEDLGVGIEDTSARIATATLTVGEETTGTSDAGAWRFELAPGRYTVTATAPGFEPASRECEVTALQETWCSIGLLATATEPVDAGAPPMTDAGAPPVTDAGADAGTEGGGGCSVSSTGAVTPWALLGLLLGAMMLRRRRGWLRASLATLVLLGCSPASRSEAPLGETRPTTEPPRLLDAAQGPSFARLGPARPLGEGLVAPALSPDGARVALTDPSLRRLEVVHLETGERVVVAEGERVGYLPRWSADGSTLRYRHPGQSGTAVPHHAFAFGGEPAPSPRPSAHVWLDEQRRVQLRDAAGERVISPEGDRYLWPQISADGSHVVFWGMSTGLFVHRVADGVTVRLGEGAHPSLGPEGRWLVFDRGEDDGHDLVAGELWITDLTDPSYRTGPLTSTLDVVETMPSIAAGKVAWTTPEGALVADFVLTE